MAEDQTQKKFTKNQSIVFDALSASDHPLSAYEILERIRDQGIRAPLQVYRALEKLVEHGVAHRLESLNAFVACKHPTCSHEQTAIFMICEKCQRASEITDASLAATLSDLVNKQSFDLKSSTVELRGSCKDCGKEA